MKKTLFATATVALAAIIITGCATQSTTAVREASGATLWAQNCARCHNSRAVTSYSDAQWEVAMLHMRVRANLTAVEHKKILEFIQSGNP